MRFIKFGLAATLSTLGLVAATAAAAPSSVANRTLRYVVVINRHATGSEVDRFAPDGTADVDFEFNDRGRGPKVHAHYAYGPDDFPRRIDVSGNNYLKAPIDEHYMVGEHGGQWHSAIEHGEAAQPGFYVSKDGSSVVELARLARALGRSQEGRAALLPGGEARMEIVAETVLKDHGQKLHVREVALTGLDFTPTAIEIGPQETLGPLADSHLVLKRPVVGPSQRY